MEVFSMTMIVTWLETYWREVLFGLFWLTQGIIFISLMVTAHRTAVIRKKINRICSKVEEYVDAVLKEDEPIRERTPAAESAATRTPTYSRSEEESRILSAVLKEIFP